MGYSLSIIINLFNYKQAVVEKLVEQISSKLKFSLEIIAVIEDQINIPDKDIKVVNKTDFYLEDLNNALNKASGKYVWVINENLTPTKLAESFSNLLNNKDYDIISFKRQFSDWTLYGIVRSDIMTQKVDFINRFIGDIITLESSFIRRSLLTQIVSNLAVKQPYTKYDQMITKIIVNSIFEEVPTIHFTSIILCGVISSDDRFLTRVIPSLWENSYKLIYLLYSTRYAQMLCLACTMYLLRQYHINSVSENKYISAILPKLNNMFSSQFFLDYFTNIIDQDALMQAAFSNEGISENLDIKYLGYNLYDNVKTIDFTFIENPFFGDNFFDLAKTYKKINVLKVAPTTDLYNSAFWQKALTVLKDPTTKKVEYNKLHKLLYSIEVINAILKSNDYYFSFSYLGAYNVVSSSIRIYPNRVVISSLSGDMLLLNCERIVAVPLCSDIINYYLSLTEEDCNRAKKLSTTYNLYRVIKNITNKTDSFIEYKGMLINVVR